MKVTRISRHSIAGTALHEIRLKTGYGTVVLCELGASIVSIIVPDKNGKSANVVLGYENIKDYLSDTIYAGSTVGRVAGRIKKGILPVNNKICQLSLNEASQTHLHGGYEGFNKKIFKIGDIRESDDSISVDLSYTSADMEEGYPGKLKLKVTYTFSDNILNVQYSATADRATAVNITNHCYFNLTGDKTRALQQELFISSSELLETDEKYIPTGRIIPVGDTANDFRTAKVISLKKDQLEATGFNEYYILDKSQTPDAVLSDPVSGRILSIKTSYPGILFYSGDYLGGQFIPCEGVCLEAQHFPDAVNQSGFPSIILEPGREYRENIEYTFSTTRANG